MRTVKALFVWVMAVKQQTFEEPNVRIPDNQGNSSQSALLAGTYQGSGDGVDSRNLRPADLSAANVIKAGGLVCAHGTVIETDSLPRLLLRRGLSPRLKTSSSE
jgi:hypothetical protein